jgi:hypothetical protein
MFVDNPAGRSARAPANAATEYTLILSPAQVATLTAHRARLRPQRQESQIANANRTAFREGIVHLNRVVPFVLAGVIAVCGCSSSQSSSSSDSATPTPAPTEAQATPEPTATPRREGESDAALVSRLASTARYALTAYISLHDDAIALVASAPVSETDTTMPQHNGNSVDLWRARARIFKVTINTNAPSFADLKSRSGPAGHRAFVLAIGVLGRLDDADQLMLNAMDDLTARCNTKTAAQSLRAADEEAHIARLAFDEKISWDSRELSAFVPDNVPNPDESDKCKRDNSGGG